MAHYNFPLRLLKLVRDAELRGEPFMTMGQAVYRVTAEIAEWFQLDVGVLEVGKRADVVVVNPEHLDSTLDDAHEAPMEDFGGLKRLVRRNDATVDAVYVGGRLAVRNGLPVPELGVERGFGQLLRAGQAS
jgi:N-acyl-D-aspartate/D-glutamate deacylase